MLCATTSCSSLAMRSRSWATALLAASSCRLTAYRRRCRTVYPMVQTTITHSATEIRPPSLKKPPQPIASSTVSASSVMYTATRTRAASRRRS